jgi:hypothetical protein
MRTANEFAASFQCRSATTMVEFKGSQEHEPSTKEVDWKPAFLGF